MDQPSEPIEEQNLESIKTQLRFLISRRGQVKASLTRFNSFLSLKSTQEDLALPTTLSEIETRIGNVQNVLDEFERIQSSIEQLCIQYNFPEQKAQDNERAEFEEQYYKIISRGKLSLETSKNLVNLVNPPPLQAPIATSANPTQNTTSNFPAKLPPISIPEFSGSYDKWMQFYETFDSLIEKNATLSNVQKFYYLQTALKGDAFQTISSLNATDHNYTIAWDLLKKRYENKKAIVHAHVKAIYNLFPVKEESHSSLRKFLDTFQKHFRSLERLGQAVSHWDTLLIFLLASKLCAKTQQEWEIFTKNIDNPSVNDFTQFLTERCQLLESIEIKSNIKPEKQYDRYGSNKTYSHVSTLSNQCPLCKENHFIYSCKKFQDLPTDSRFNEAKRSNLCTNCLRHGHATSECRSIHLCRFCQKRHHSLLHQTQKREQGTFYSRKYTPQPQANLIALANRDHCIAYQPQSPNAAPQSAPIDNYNCQNQSFAPTASGNRSSNHCYQSSHNFYQNFDLVPISSRPDYSNEMQDNRLLSQPYGIMQKQVNPTPKRSQVNAQNGTPALVEAGCSQSKPNNISNPNSTLSYATTKPNKLVLLATALVYVYDKNQSPIMCKALLDGGSQSNFITENLSRKLHLPSEKVNIPISGINQGTTFINQRINLNVSSISKRYNFKISTLVISKITETLPQQVIELDLIDIPEDLHLADPNFYEPSDIDMLIGAGLFFDLLMSGQIKLGKGNPTLQQTKLGWIISGPISLPNLIITSMHCFLSVNDNDLYQNIEKFWKIEELPANENMAKFSKEERECEAYFTHTLSRTHNGRFQVSLPLKGNVNNLGNSLDSAIKRFFALERKLDKNPELKISYSNFIKEYHDLGHMSKVDPAKIEKYPIYYLPHHAVEKSDSLTTKLRVVFDGSAKTSSDISLNDSLKVGPTIQSDLFSIIIRFRQHNVVITGDIAKMYRQILIEPAQRCLQRIVWRDNKEDQLTHFELNTITYGTASASFLATRCLQQISIECESMFPKESHILSHDCYVDDIITGAQTADELIAIRNNLTSMLKEYKFELRKFASNDPKVLTNLNNEDSKDFLLNSAQGSKTLGISWDSQSDHFIYSSNAITLKNDVTKRSILSIISQIFDPLGLLGPIIVQAKILLQKLWLLKISWDEPVPNELSRIWINFTKQLSDAISLKIPRQVTSNNPKNIQLHGFSDSSINAYGACIYIRCEDLNGKIATQLLCAKSRVAPLKVISLPRLELCGALLLTKLLKGVRTALDLSIDKLFYWTDSTIVLCWLSLEPRNLKTFVGNRVSEIQQICDTNDWYHIKSSQNPADLISRGIVPNELKHSQLWWHGPTFLSQDSTGWPSGNHISNYAHRSGENFPEIPEFNSKSIIVTTTLTALESFTDIFERASNYTRLLHIVAYILRFCRNCKVPRNQREYGPLKQAEISDSLKHIVKIVQNKAFSEDLNNIKRYNSVKPSSHLSSLNPFIDEDSILRVGGRLKNANLNFKQKHPIVLPTKHRFSELIVLHEHIRNLHSGCQATLSSVRQQFWPLKGKGLVKSILRKCIPCFRANPRPLVAQMGDLPTARVVPSYPFCNTGVDYAGPFLLKDSKFRNKKILKCYICVFVCFATKAVHLELATELTTASFIAAFKRFTARRGICQNLYSDNGTQFVGANNELANIYSLLKSSEIQDYLVLSDMQWHFIPSRSPHFGGMWEAAVKSVKQHLKRILNDTKLNYEEFYTFLVQVEGVLNSRPLTALTDDPNDFEALTPGHFLIGRALNAVPEPDVSQTPSNRLANYAHLQKLVQHFWSRWSCDYLHTLHQRYKWKLRTKVEDLLGSLAIIKEDGLPPLQWRLGRIVSLHPGSDSVVRVVGLKTKNGIIKRSVVKICPLPKDQNIVSGDNEQ